MSYDIGKDALLKWWWHWDDRAMNLLNYSIQLISPVILVISSVILVILSDRYGDIIDSYECVILSHKLKYKYNFIES